MSIGAFLSIMFMSDLNLHPALAIVLALVAGAIIGIILSRFPFGPLIGQGLLSIFLVTMGLMVLMRAVIIMVWGGHEIRYFPPFLPQATLSFEGVALYPRELFGFGVAVFLLLLFLAFLRYTRWGLVMRAASDDTQVARSLGINLKVIIAIALAIGTAVAAVGGVILGINNGVSTSLGDIGLAGLAAVLVGGMESILGGVVGGFIIGITVALTGYYVGHGFGSVAAYIVMLAVLLVRPYGLLGQKRIERV